MTRDLTANRLTDDDRAAMRARVAEVRRHWGPQYRPVLGVDVTAAERAAMHAIGCDARDLRDVELDEVRALVLSALDLPGAEVLTRRSAVRGSRVRVVLSRGSAAGAVRRRWTERGDHLTGVLIGWGAQVVEVAPDAAARAAGWTWRRHAVPVTSVDRVEVLP